MYFLLEYFNISSIYDGIMPIGSGIDEIEGRCDAWYLK